MSGWGVDGDGCSPEAAAADDHLVHAGVADHYPLRPCCLGAVQVGECTAERAGVLVHVEEHGQPAGECPGFIAQVGGDVAEHGGGEL